MCGFRILDIDEKQRVTLYCLKKETALKTKIPYQQLKPAKTPDFHIDESSTSTPPPANDSVSNCIHDIKSKCLINDISPAPDADITIIKENNTKSKKKTYSPHTPSSENGKDCVLYKKSMVK